MPKELGVWLRRQREARNWTRPEMARRLTQAAQAKGDRSVPGVESLCHNIYRWERGAEGPSERYKLAYCQALGIPASRFGPGHPDARTPPALAGPSLSPPATVAYRGMQPCKMDGSTAEREVLMAAHEGSDHAQRAERRDIGDTTLEQLRADVIRLSALSMTGEPFPLFQEMQRVRDRIFALLDQQLWPRDQTALYFLVSCLSDLMAVAASGLGYPHAAEELIRSGWAYATIIDHRPLLAHLRLQLASIMYWHGQPRLARDLAEDGLRYLSEGPNATHLHIKYARAAARIGDADGARRAISAAADARQPDYHDDLLEIGGEFGLSRATEHYFAGSALADIPGAQREASKELADAVDLYAAGPGPREQHWFGGKALAGVDLAAIQVRSGALDAATAALEPVLTLPRAQRITAVTTRLGLVRTELSAPIFRESARAQDLDERIEEFGRDTITAELHSLPGGPN